MNARSNSQTASLATGIRPVRVFIVAQEWCSAHGGLATMNRSLSIALAAAGASVVCLMPEVRREDYEDAAAHDVILIEARPVPGGTAQQAMLRKPVLPHGWRPNLVIGHGRVTGPEALGLTQDFFGEAKRLQVVHVAPDEIEWWKEGRTDDAGVRAQARTELELDLAVSAHRTVAVGPRLHARMRRDLSVHDGVPEPVRLDPGFDHTDLDVVRTPPPGGPDQVLLMGRIEDYEIKGVGLAAQALAHAMRLRGPAAPKIELLVRGAPPGESAALRERLIIELGDAAMQVTVRPFTTDQSALRHDLLRASLLLMPSSAEGYGLVGLEGITAGTPVLLSGQSGLGQSLSGVVYPAGATGPVVPVTSDPTEDADRWGHRIAAVLEDRDAAFRRADWLKRELAAKWTWKSAAEDLLSL